MLTEKEKQVLHKAFEEENLEVLSLTAAEKISAAVGISIKKVEWFSLDSKIIPARYQRNIGSLGIDGQKRLLESSVVVVGLGGLGGLVCEELARVGTGKIAGVDPDVFDETNLNRQIISNQENIGCEKAEQTKKRIEIVNNATEFTAYASLLTEVEDNVWKKVSLVFDCLDNIKDRLVLAKKCSELDICLIHGAIAGFYLEVGIVWPKSEILEQIYKGQNQGIEKQLGTPSFTAATAASLMAAEGVKVLIGKYKKKDNKLRCFDLLEDCWQTMTF